MMKYPFLPKYKCFHLDPATWILKMAKGKSSLMRKIEQMIDSKWTNIPEAFLLEDDIRNLDVKAFCIRFMPDTVRATWTNNSDYDWEESFRVKKNKGVISSFVYCRPFDSNKFFLMISNKGSHSLHLW